MGYRGLLPFPRQEILGDHQSARSVSSRRGRTDGRTFQHSRGLWRGARRRRPHRRQTSRSERYQRDADVRVDASIGTCWNVDRADGQRARLAHHGKHLGGQLGQSRSRVGVGREHARIGRRAVSCDRSCWRSRRQAVHGLAGAGLSELRAVAGRRFAAASVRVPHDTRASRASGVRRTVSAPADPEDRASARRRVAGAHSDARTCRHPRDPARQRLRAGRATAARVGNVGREPRRRVRLCSSRQRDRASHGRKRRTDRVARDDSRGRRRPARRRAATG